MSNTDKVSTSPGVSSAVEAFWRPDVPANSRDVVELSEGATSRLAATEESSSRSFSCADLFELPEPGGIRTVSNKRLYVLVIEKARSHLLMWTIDPVSPFHKWKEKAPLLSLWKVTP